VDQGSLPFRPAATTTAGPSVAGPGAPSPLTPIRVGGNIKAPIKTKDVKPAYPAIAQSARVSGVVIAETIIGTDGRVTNVTVMRSIPLLDAAALEAVRQWEFMPTLVNGQPTPVVMPVTVNFQLDK
jgi:protein TonB